jgi:hypothetical protein
MSIFNQEIKGMILLVGVLISSFITSMFGNFFERSESDNPFCRMITVGQMENISNLPLGQTILSYIFFYLVVFISMNPGAVSSNITTLTLFPILIIADAVWNKVNNCFNTIQIFVSLLIGAVVGVVWGFIIYSTKSQYLQYFSGYNSKEVCSKPTKNTFKCSVFKNGKLLSSTNATNKF